MGKKKYKNPQDQWFKDDAIDSRRLANENLALIDKPRKKVVRSFVLDSDRGECPACFLPLEAGQRVRYNENELKHVTHKKVEKEYQICQSCWLTKPCDCDS